MSGKERILAGTGGKTAGTATSTIFPRSWPRVSAGVGKLVMK